MSSAFQRRGLRKAVEALGGEVQLRQLLDVPSTDLSTWLRDRQATVPEAVMRKVVNLLADIEAGLIGSAEQRAPQSPAEPRGS